VGGGRPLWCSSSHFPLTPYSNNKKPIALPPGRAKARNIAGANRVNDPREHHRHTAGRLEKRRHSRAAEGHDYRGRERDYFLRPFAVGFGIARAPADIEPYIANCRSNRVVALLAEKLPPWTDQGQRKESVRNTGSPKAWSAMTNRTPANGSIFFQDYFLFFRKVSTRELPLPIFRNPSVSKRPHISAGNGCAAADFRRIGVHKRAEPRNSRQNAVTVPVTPSCPNDFYMCLCPTALEGKATSLALG
jgi:hypothetical protein